MGVAWCGVFGRPDRRDGDGQRNQIWNGATGKELFTVEQNIPGFAVLFSPDGEYLAVMGDGGGREGRRLELWARRRLRK